jgi:hypothetical protein
VLVREVNSNLDIRKRRDKCPAPLRGSTRHDSIHQAESLPTLRLGFRRDEIGETLDLREIETTVLHRATRELTGIGGPEAGETNQRVEHGAHDSKAAVHMQLDSILSGETAGSRKPKNQRLIDQCPGLPVNQTPERSLTQPGLCDSKGIKRRSRVWA